MAIGISYKGILELPTMLTGEVIQFTPPVASNAWAEEKYKAQAPNEEKEGWF